MKAAEAMLAGAIAGATVMAALSYTGVVRLSRMHPPAGWRGYSGPDPWASDSNAIKLFTHLAEVRRGNTPDGSWMDVFALDGTGGEAAPVFRPAIDALVPPSPYF